MSKTSLIIAETFLSGDGEERKKRIQKRMEQYLMAALANELSRGESFPATMGKGEPAN